MERALATNLLGPFRLTKALLGSLAASAREGRGAVVINISSDAAVNAYPRWGAYGASKAALHHLSRIWDEELQSEGVRFLSIDPGDMDTPLHAAAVPDADRSTLKRPEAAARELADAVAAALSRRPIVPEAVCMIAADLPVQRPSNAKLLMADGQGQISSTVRGPSSRTFCAQAMWWSRTTPPPCQPVFRGRHGRTGRPIEVRLAGRASLDEVRQFSAVVFGEGDFRTRTEDRAEPPTLNPGDRLELGPLRATVGALLNHPRFILLRFAGHHGRSGKACAARATDPVLTRSHTACRLGHVDADRRPAGRVRAAFSRLRLDWSMLASMSARKIRFGTITHAAGISSTGDPRIGRAACRSMNPTGFPGQPRR